MDDIDISGIKESCKASLEVKWGTWSKTEEQDRNILFPCRFYGNCQFEKWFIAVKFTPSCHLTHDEWEKLK